MQLSVQRAASWNVKSCRKTTYGSVQKQNVPKMKNRNVVFKSKNSYRWSGTIRKRPNYAKLWNKLKKCTKLDLKRITEEDLARSGWTGSKLNRFLLFFMDFLEVMQSTFAQQGAGRDKKENFAVCKVVFFFHSFPFVCALIGKPSLFRWGALFMTQPQTCSLKAYTHRHTHTIFFLPRQPRLSWHQPCLLSELTSADPALP